LFTQIQANGYDVRGWAINKQEESELKDAKLEKFAILEQKRQLRLTTIVLGGLLVAYFVYLLFSYFFGSQPLPILEAAVANETLAGTAETVLEGEEVLVDVEPAVA
jgi:hypothetical protein